MHVSRVYARYLRCGAALALAGLFIPGLGEAVHAPATNGSGAPAKPSGSYSAAGDFASGALDQLPYVPGRLVVKVKQAVQECLDCLAAQGRTLAPALGSAHVDDLNRRYGLHRIRPLRKVYRRLKTLAARRQLQTRQRRHRRAGRRTGGGAAAGAALTTLTSTSPDFASTYVFELSPWFDMERIAREYARDPAVVYAEPDRKASIQLTPDDPYFSSSGSWGQPFDDLWGIKLISAPTAWDTATGAGVVVAVTDTGVDPNQPDIAANMWTNPGEIPGNAVDDDGNGYVDDVYGWNFYDDSADVFDDHGHGTHVAGTIAAVGNNTLGVIGVAWKSKVMALKGLNSGGYGSYSDLADAIVYAADKGADVINASWGGVGESQVMSDAIGAAHAAGVVFVAAAGNSYGDVDELDFYPAKDPRAITVSAFDHLDQKADFSNSGAKIDVAAPGGGDSGSGFAPFRSVLSLASSGAGSTMTGNGKLVVGGDYIRQAGTSMAAPHVAGAAAVILSAHPGYTPGQVRQALRAGADDVGDPGYDFESGYGRINVASSVALAALDAEILTPENDFVAIGSQVTFTGSAAGAGFASYTFEYGTGDLPASWTLITGPVVTPVQDGTLALWDITDVPDGDYVVRLRVENTDGASFEDRVRITLDRLVIVKPEGNTILIPSGPFEVRGSAAGGDFQSFRVEWRITGPDYVNGPWRSDGITLAGGGSSPVYDGLLATFDTSLITENTDVDFQVVITRPADEIPEDVRHVIFDPTLRAGWPQQIAGLPQFRSSSRLLHHMTIADLDGDGTKEILAAYGDMVYVFRHDGTPVSGWPQQLDAGSVPNPFNKRSPAAADLDGDGRLEVVASAGLDIYVWHDDGSAMTGWPKQFRHAYSSDPKDSYSPTSGGPRGDFVLSDVDGDGRRDIVAVIGPALFVIDADGNVLRGWPQKYPLDWPCILSRECYQPVLAVGDTNGNGKKEIAAVTLNVDTRWENGQLLLLYAANGTVMPRFPRKITRKHYGDTNGFFKGDFNSPIMADTDGDGDLEIIVILNKTRVKAYHHTGRRSRLRPRAKGTVNDFCWKTRIPPMLEPPTAGDLDGDGKAEIFTSGHVIRTKWRQLHGGNILWTLCPSLTSGPDYINLLQKGAPRAGWPVQIQYSSGDNSHGPGAVAIGDIDGDLKPDIISGSGICKWEQPRRLMDHRCFTVNAYDAAGNLLAGFPKSTPGPGSTMGVTPAIGDLDGDGLKEIAWIDFYGNILVWNVSGTPAPEAMQWPMFRHDPAHTGALVANP